LFVFVVKLVDKYEEEEEEEEEEGGKQTGKWKM
jgi:hypothetical protein